MNTPTTPTPGAALARYPAPAVRAVARVEKATGVLKDMAIKLGEALIAAGSNQKEPT